MTGSGTWAEKGSGSKDKAEKGENGGEGRAQKVGKYGNSMAGRVISNLHNIYIWVVCCCCFCGCCCCCCCCCCLCCRSVCHCMCAVFNGIPARNPLVYWMPTNLTSKLGVSSDNRDATATWRTHSGGGSSSVETYF